MMKRARSCCGDPRVVRGVEGGVCVNCGTMDQGRVNIVDSSESLYFDERGQVAGGVLNQVEKRRGLVAARELLQMVAERIKGLSFKDRLVEQTLQLVERCYRVRETVLRTDPDYLAFPKDLNLLYCACMVHVVNTSPQFVGRVAVVEDILNNCTFKCKAPRERLRVVLTELEKNRLIGQGIVVGEADKLTEGLRVFLNELSTPGKLTDWLLELHGQAMKNVWFNGKKPGIIAATVVVHVFLGGCPGCEERVEAMRTKQHRASLVKVPSVREFLEYYRRDKEMFLGRIKTRFEVNMAIVTKCNEIIMEKHYRRGEEGNNFHKEIKDDNADVKATAAIRDNGPAHDVERCVKA